MGHVIETFRHILECENVKNYFADLSTILGMNKSQDSALLLGIIICGMIKGQTEDPHKIHHK